MNRAYPLRLSEATVGRVQPTADVDLANKKEMKKYQPIGKIACFVTALLLIANCFGRSVVAGASSSEAKPVRVTTNFDGDWRFLRADATGAEKPEFDDSTWRNLDV